MTKVLFLLFALAWAALFVTACDTNPTGPQILNSGDNNAFSISTESNGPNAASTPAPVVVPPVIVAPEPE